mmetsp:Transcript_27757/g.98922  ORF Transcript_27757/g.98922 Transcript_27757/m.98922 type:complete len:279 (-) Transcript_27757:144-980(-)
MQPQVLQRPGPVYRAARGRHGARDVAQLGQRPERARVQRFDVRLGLDLFGSARRVAIVRRQRGVRGGLLQRRALGGLEVFALHLSALGLDARGEDSQVEHLVVDAAASHCKVGVDGADIHVGPRRVPLEARLVTVVPIRAARRRGEALEEARGIQVVRRNVVRALKLARQHRPRRNQRRHDLPRHLGMRRRGPEARAGAHGAGDGPSAALVPRRRPSCVAVEGPLLLRLTLGSFFPLGAAYATRVVDEQGVDEQSQTRSHRDRTVSKGKGRRAPSKRT